MRVLFCILLICFNSMIFSQNFSLENISTTGYNDPFFTFNIWEKSECSFSAMLDTYNCDYFNFQIEKENYQMFVMLDKKIPKYITENNSNSKIMILSGKINSLDNKNIGFTPTFTVCYNSGFYGDLMSFSQNQNKSYQYVNQSSFLVEGVTKYSVENLAILNSDSPWVEGVDGYGIGEGFTVDFKLKNDKYLLIINGYISFQKPYLYEQNARIKKIKITGLQSNKTAVLDVLDTPHPQSVDISFLNDTEGFSVEIVEVFPGTKYEDTCIHYLVPYDSLVIPYE